MKKEINIEIAYAGVSSQVIIPLVVPVGTCVLAAINASLIRQLVPEIKISHNCIGIFGKKVLPNTPLQAGDRIEIYRQLLRDPKEARRLRAKKNYRATQSIPNQFIPN